MSLVKFSYKEYENEPRYWEISNATFANINLIAGKNSSGKSRLLSVINSFGRFLTGQYVPAEPCKFLALIQLNEHEFSYEIAFKDGGVIGERLDVDGVNKLFRGEDGSGKIWYEKQGDFLDFKLPINALAAVNRRDEIQHPFLIELHQWASSIVMYAFGSDFGRSQLMDLSRADKIFNSPTPQKINDTNDLVGIYTSSFIRFGNEFDKAVIADMNKLGYSLTDVGSDNLQKFLNFPIAALGMFTTESELGFQNSQVHMSQGMFRALALTIHLNLCAISKEKKLMLVDDIGEGLDFERSVAIIGLLISKAQENNLQIIMTTNDRFVMNEVPLEYWSVLKRKAGIVKMFNIRNSEEQFKKFKYLGLNNFEFFASDFFEPKVANE